MDDRKLDLNLLLALEALLAELNVTRAAKRLNLSQPALSAQLARLRDVFGDQLLIPTSRGVSPTAMASEMQIPLRHVLDQMRGLVDRARSFDPGRARMVFGIAASDYMQAAVLLPFLTQLHMVAPEVQILVRAVHTPKADLERGDADVAFLQSGEVQETEFRSLDVLREGYVGITRKHSLVSGVMSAERFMSARHIIVSPRAQGFKGPTDEALEAIGLARKVVLAVSSFVMLVEAVAGSDLIALAPRRLAARYADQVDTFEPPVSVAGFRISMVWHERTHDHPARAWLRAQLADFCSRN